MVIKRILCLIIILTVCPAPAQKKSAGEGLLLSDLMKAPSEYSGREIVLILKLKNRDDIFEKLVFYDRRNADISFDISSKETKKRLSKAFLNLHEGLDYRVKFLVKSIDPVSGVVGEIFSLEPVLIEKLP